ncbi:Oxygen sensor protein DosP [Paraliobacillus sp. PM-2]|uniref:bifunctional diguanylate cyclase/phosphodiesterase n=1 Tax=Paraliobacillus sp. PM-2 TaxID=1462524 RepID=UPI00061C16D0|nr:EAL domain-containing protein [Paraliobacillus sp. PM-2]CQR45980.1 Oxygen sensor protein DosP [Paraliobacillus sp. PM-2]
MFFQPDSNYSIAIEGHYNWLLVLLSLLIAWFSSYVAISSNQRLKKNSFFHKNIWLLFSSIAMGIGIWAMHFIGMSAYQLPIPIQYNHYITILSILPAIGAAFLAFRLINRPIRSLNMNIISSVSMGIGIIIMHSLGMHSMISDAQTVYRFDMFIIACIIAVAISFLSLFSISMFDKQMGNKGLKFFISLLLAAAISIMHYVAMLGTTFYIPKNYLTTQSDIKQFNTILLIAMVATSVSILLLLLMASIFLDRYIDHRVRFFDTQTRLPNGRYYEKEIQKNANNLVLAVWQINSLDEINHAYSYDDGDKLVDYIANTLKSVRLLNTTLYRMKGNQFAFLMHRTDRITHLEQVMQEIAKVWDDPIFLEEKPIHLETSCAITYSENNNAKDLYSDALTVFSHPSTRFQQDVVLYDPTIHRFSFDQKILTGLDQAMEKNELFLVYQPKICSNSSEVIGFEALIRWKHPEYGHLSPGTFIPIIERTDRIFDLTDWVINTACQQLKKWRQQKHIEWTIAINIPGDYVSSPRLVDTLQHMYKQYQIESVYIELELTETSFVQSIEEAKRSITTFRTLGYSVALDDFGTGLSSLSYLKKMEISTLKVDKSFVDHVPESLKDASILKAMIDLGQSLGLQVVIEGIETKEQVDYLQKVADSLLFQGYYFAKPMKPTEVITWVKKHYLE